MTSSLLLRLVMSTSVLQTKDKGPRQIVSATIARYMMEIGQKAEIRALMTELHGLAVGILELNHWRSGEGDHVSAARIALKSVSGAISSPGNTEERSWQVCKDNYHRGWADFEVP